MAMRPLDVALEAVRYLSMTVGESPPTPAPTAEQVAEAERLLGRPLPPSYLGFIAEAGMIMPEGWDLYWVGGPDLERRNIVVANQVERDHPTSPLPPFLIAFFDDDTGDQYCFDTRPRGRDDLEEELDAIRTGGLAPASKHDPLEYPVVLWDREKDRDTQLNEGLFVAADDFLDWVKGYIKEHF